MTNEAEINPSVVTVAGDSVQANPNPAVAAIVETHHEHADTDKLVLDIQKAGVPEAQSTGASVAPSTTTSSDLVALIEKKTDEANRNIHKNYKPEKPGGWKIISDLMRSGRQKLEQFKAA